MTYILKKINEYFYKLLNFILKISVSRLSFILMNLATLVFSIKILKYIFSYIHQEITPEEIDKMSKTVNSVANILVGLGVFMESRIVVMKITKSIESEIDEYLNKIAEHNGMGLLMFGLGIEILTTFIEAPNDVVDTRGIELTFLYICISFVIITMCIELDLIKDYIKTFFKKPIHEEK